MKLADRVKGIKKDELLKSVSQEFIKVSFKLKMRKRLNGIDLLYNIVKNSQFKWKFDLAFQEVSTKIIAEEIFKIYAGQVREVFPKSRPFDYETMKMKKARRKRYYSDELIITIAIHIIACIPEAHENYHNMYARSQFGQLSEYHNKTIIITTTSDKRSYFFKKLLLDGTGVVAAKYKFVGCALEKLL